MYGLRNKSVIFKLKRPETRIGRHNSNHVVLTKSLKVSRYHAVINFHHDGTPLIKDISEWGVYLNNIPIGKNRWAELKLGDVLALGALKIEDGGHVLEVVPWGPEDKTPRPDCKIEVIDMTDEVSDTEEVICVSDEESKVHQQSCAPPRASSSTTVTETISVTKSVEITVISDCEDEVELLPTTQCKQQEISDCADAIEELPPIEEKIIPANDVKFVECALAVESKFEDEGTSLTGTFTDVTTTMNGLLLQSPKLPEDLKELPSFKNIFDYASEDSNDSLTNFGLEEDLEDNSSKGEEKDEDVYDYRSPLSVFSEAGDENDNDASESSESSVPSPSEEAPATKPIIHRTLLTNKVAKIAVIAPLPNKAVVKRRRRIRSDSPDSMFDRVRNAEYEVKSPRPSKSKGGTRESHKASPPSSKSEKKKEKDPTLGRDKASMKAAMKEARERVKALYSGLPVRPKRDPSTRPQPRVKITDKNRGDFLTRIEPKRVPRSPAKPTSEPISREVTSDQLTPTKSPAKPLANTNDDVVSRDPTTPTSSPNSEEPDKRKSIDEILDTIEVPKTDTLSEAIPAPKSRTIEVVVDFKKHRPPPPPPLADYAKAIAGGSILKKPYEAQSLSEKKRVRFPSEVVTSRMNINYGASTSAPSPMIKKRCLGPPDCFDCGEGCLSRKFNQNTQPVVNCSNCFRDGHSSRECPRSVMCFNCKEFGHKGNHCPLPDIRKAKQMRRDPRLRAGLEREKFSRWSDKEKQDEDD